MNLMKSESSQQPEETGAVSPPSIQIGELRHRDVKCLVYNRKWQGWSVKPGRRAVASHPRLFPNDCEAFAGGVSSQSCV